MISEPHKPPPRSPSGLIFPSWLFTLSHGQCRAPASSVQLVVQGGGRGTERAATGLHSQTGQGWEPLSQGLLDVTLQVEVWLNRVLVSMRSTLRHLIPEALVTYEEKPREQWVFDYPAQVGAAVQGQTGQRLREPRSEGKSKQRARGAAGAWRWRVSLHGRVLCLWFAAGRADVHPDLVDHRGWRGLF